MIFMKIPLEITKNHEFSFLHQYFGDFQENFHQNHRKNNENRKDIFFGFDKVIGNHALKLDSKGKTIRNGSFVPLSFVRGGSTTT